MGFREQRLRGSGVNALESRGGCLSDIGDGVACVDSLLECYTSHTLNTFGSDKLY